MGERKSLRSSPNPCQTMMYRRACKVENLESLYHEDENDGDISRSGSTSETDDVVELESLHASETDAEENEDEWSEQEEGLVTASYVEPARKRGRFSYLHSKSGHKWSLNYPKSRDNSREKSQTVHVPTVKGNALNTHTPVDTWNILFSNEILEIISKHTNEKIDREIQSMKNKNTKIDCSHKHIDVVELKALIGLLYYAGVHKMSKSETINWWGIHGKSLFRATMQRNRFTFLMKCLRFNAKKRVGKKATDHFTHISKIWDLFITNCINNYEPDSKCTIDEQLLSFHGRCIFKMYIPAKPDKYGLKIVSLNDALTHYMYNAIPYFGIVNKYENENVPSYYVRKLSEPIHGTGRNITCNSYFTSYPICNKLQKDFNLTLVGTIKKNKCEIPESFKKVPENKSKVQFCYLDNKTLVSYNSEKNKIILLLSSLHQTGEIDQETGKPEIVVFYNKTKSGTDSFNFKCYQYSVARKTLQWPLRMFYGMLDQANVNSFILYNLNEDNEVMKRVHFIYELVLGLVRPFLIKRLATQTLRIKVRNLIEDFIRNEDIPKDQDIKHYVPDNKMDKQKRCGLCPSNMDRKTNYKCLRCELPMCRDHVAKICCVCGR